MALSGPDQLSVVTDTGAASAGTGTSADLDGTITGAELSIWAAAMGVWGKPVVYDGPLPVPLSSEGYTASAGGVRATAADKLTSEDVVELDRAVLNSTGIFNPAGVEGETWASGPTSATEGVDNGSISEGGAEVIWDAGKASAAEGGAAASAAFAFSAALLSISSIRRCTILGISCT